MKTVLVASVAAVTAVVGQRMEYGGEGYGTRGAQVMPALSEKVAPIPAAESGGDNVDRYVQQTRNAIGEDGSDAAVTEPVPAPTNNTENTNPAPAIGRNPNATDSPSPSSPSSPAGACYRVDFRPTWDEPQDIGEQFSPLVIWTTPSMQAGVPIRSGELASPGVQLMAETGNATLIRQELEASPEVGNVTVGSGPISSPAPTAVDAGSKTYILVTPDHPYAHIASMIAPSPDWYVLGSVSLYNNETSGFVDQEGVEQLVPYDAGTDSGSEFQSADQPTTPAEPISRLTEPVVGNGTADVAYFRVGLDMCGVKAAVAAGVANDTMNVTVMPTTGTEERRDAPLMESDGMGGPVVMASDRPGASAMAGAGVTNANMMNEVGAASSGDRMVGSGPGQYGPVSTMATGTAKTRRTRRCHKKRKLGKRYL